MPKVSVIVPCYNCGPYIGETIDSVLSQTYQDFEIIIINDGSSEAETVSILRAFDKPKTKVIHTDNQGPAAARNTGIKASSGIYILPLDGDDKIGSTYMEKAVSILDHRANIGIVYCEAEFFGGIVGKWPLPEYQFPRILLGNMIFCSGFYRRSDWERTEGYDPNPLLQGWEDYDFWLYLIELGVEVYRLPEVLFFYRRRTDSISASFTREHSVNAFCRLFNNHFKLYTENAKVIFEELVDLQRDQIKSQFTVKELRAEIEQSQSTVQQLQQKITSMQSSPFWTLRERWLKLREAFPSNIKSNGYSI